MGRPTSRGRPDGSAPSSTTCPTAPSTPPSGSSSTCSTPAPATRWSRCAATPWPASRGASGPRHGSPRSTCPYATIREGSPDLLIVTGSNPLAPRIEDEPYWEDLAALLSWGRGHVPSMLLSCLSAHAALAVFDGIERTTLDAKCTGVFPQQAHSHPLTAGLGPSIVLPHSRLNTVGLDEVRAAGYEVALESEAVGWSVDHQVAHGSEVVLVQGHPEYDPSSLLREYRRDARRYVRHERDDVPCLPLHCVAPDDWEQLRPAPRSGRRRAGSGAGRGVSLRRGRGQGRLALAGHGHPALRQLDGRSDQEERLRPCTTRPSPSTAGTRPTGPGRWPCPSTRRWPTTSSTPSTPGRSSTWRCRASTTTGSTTRPTTSWRSASPPSRGARPALVLASGMAAVSYAILTVARAGSNFVVAPQLYGATFTYFAHVLPTLGHRGPLRRGRPGRVDRAPDR